MTRVAVQTEARAACVTLLGDYAADAGVKLQVYPARPRSLFPPTAFIDGMGESGQWAAGDGGDRTPTVDILLVWGTFDSADTANQRDAFVDGFYAWVADRPHAMHANSVIESWTFTDEPTFVPDWVAPKDQVTYFATRLSLTCLFPNT